MCAPEKYQGSIKQFANHGQMKFPAASGWGIKKSK
jgi:hypothetical protein